MTVWGAVVWFSPEQARLAVGSVATQVCCLSVLLEEWAESAHQSNSTSEVPPRGVCRPFLFSLSRKGHTASAVPAVTSAVFLIHHCSQPGTPCLTPVHPRAERAGCGGPYVSSCLWAGPPEISCPVKCSVCVVFYSSVLFSVLSPSVLNHLSASLMQLCRRNLCGCLTQPRHHSAPGLAGEH